MIDISKVKVGDFVLARGRVLSIDTADPRRRFRLAWDENGEFVSWPPVASFVGHEPAPFAVGDKIKTRGMGAPREVLAVHGDCLFLRGPRVPSEAFLGAAADYERVS